MSNPAIRILSVDDHPLLRDGIAAVLESQPDMTLVGQACNGREAIEDFRRLRPDITLMDLRMPDISGIEAITAIRAEFSNARIIVLTTYAGDAQAAAALRAGARVICSRTWSARNCSRPFGRCTPASAACCPRSPPKSPSTWPTMC